jgi:hypothetical protein
MRDVSKDLIETHLDKEQLTAWALKNTIKKLRLVITPGVCTKNCVNLFDDIIHKEVTWYLTEINLKKFSKKKA